MSLRIGKDESKRERRVVSGWGEDQTPKGLSAVKRSLGLSLCNMEEL